MSEYIEREIALAALSKSGVTCNMRASKIVAQQPAADVAPVVRCRECVHNHPEFVKNEAQWCELCRMLDGR